MKTDKFWRCDNPIINGYNDYTIRQVTPYLFTVRRKFGIELQSFNTLEKAQEFIQGLYEKSVSEIIESFLYTEEIDKNKKREEKNLEWKYNSSDKIELNAKHIFCEYKFEIFYTYPVYLHITITIPDIEKLITNCKIVDIIEGYEFDTIEEAKAKVLDIMNVLDIYTIKGN